MKITAKDFERLHSQSAQWAGYGWEIQADRFELDPGESLDLTYAQVYWFDTYADLVLSRIYLESINESSQTAYDGGAESYILLSNYRPEYAGRNA